MGRENLLKYHNFYAKILFIKHIEEFKSQISKKTSPLLAFFGKGLIILNTDRCFLFYFR